MGTRGPVKGSRRFGVVKGGKSKPPAKPPEKPRTKRPAVPKWVPPEGRKLLRKIIPELEALGILKPQFLPGLAALATHYAILAMAVEEMEGASGRFQITTSDPDHPAQDGQPAIRKHPMLSVIANHSEKLKAWVAEFALTPAAEVRLNIKPPKGATKLEKFLKDG